MDVLSTLGLRRHADSMSCAIKRFRWRLKVRRHAMSAAASGQTTMWRSALLTVAFGGMALAQSTDASTQAWRLLENGASSKSRMQRTAAVRSLNLLWRGSAAEKLALAALDDKEPDVREAAVTVLGNLHVRSAIPSLQRKLSDKNTAVAMAAARALTRMREPISLDFYRDVLTGARKTDRGFVGEGIGMINTVPKVTQLATMTASGFIPFGGPAYMMLQMAGHDGSTAARVIAAQSLAADHTPTARAALLKAMNDKQPLVAAAAVEALAQQGCPELFTRVEQMLLDPKRLPANQSEDEWAAINHALLEGSDRAGRAVLRYTLAAAYLRLKNAPALPTNAFSPTRTLRTEEPVAR